MIIVTHKDILTLTENSIKNLLAIAEANKIKLVNIGSLVSITDNLSLGDYICQGKNISTKVISDK